MGYLTVFNEKGFPHSGCYLEYDEGGAPEWLGYFPSPYEPMLSSIVGGAGHIIADNRSNEVNWYVRWWMHDQTIFSARNITVTEYWCERYLPLVSDCVSFARDLASAAGLTTTGGPAWTPIGLVVDLARLNPWHSNYSDKRPFPWQK